MFNICQVSQMLRVMSLTEFDDRGLFQISFFGHGCRRSSCFSFGAGLLEQENGRLKKMVADRDLEIDVLKEITRK